MRLRGLKPLGNRVLLEPLEKEEPTSSGIILPDSAKGRARCWPLALVGF